MNTKFDLTKGTKPVKSKPFCEINMLRSTVSNTVVKITRTRTTQSMLLKTLKSAYSVLCIALKPDWKISSKLPSCRYFSPGFQITFVIIIHLHVVCLCFLFVQFLTKGCETSEMTLRRNGLGQLGFHVNYEGIVAEVSLIWVEHLLT